MLETSTNPLPKLRADLVVSRQTSDGTPVYVVKDPVADRYFRFREIEGYLLNHLDGRIDPEVLRQKVEAEFGATLPRATLDQFLTRLKNLGLLDDSDAAVVAKPSRVGGDVLYLRIKAFNPDALLTGLEQRLKFFFTPAFVSMAAALIVGAAMLTVANWREIQLDFPRLFNVSSLAIAYVTVLLVIILHEFAHGLTCKHFGGRVRELGIMLIYLQPTLYCNISDAWLFPKKAQRLWVTFAGAFFELGLWAVACFTWRVTDPYTITNYMALVVMLTSGIKTLFNLNPLIKLDGYYLLSDWLNLPNLRGRAFGYWGAFFKKVWTFGASPLPRVSQRERWIFLSYGLLAAVYSYGLFALVAAAIMNYLVGHYRGWGFAAFALFLLLTFRWPLKKLLNAARPPATLPAKMSLPVKRALRWSLLLLGVAALFVVRMDLRVSGEFTVLPEQNADVRAAVDGIIASVHADENDAVRKGELIVSLAERDVQAEILKFKAQREEAQAKLSLLEAGSRAEQLELARTTVSKGQERVTFAQARLDMDAKLFEQKLASQRELEDTREQLQLRHKELQEAQDNLRLLLAGSRKEELEAIQAELRRLEAQLRYTEEQAALLKVASPIDGVVVTHKLKDRLGEAVKKGDLIAKVHELKTVTAEIAVPESEIAEVRTGQSVALRVRAYPDRSFTGKVFAIAPVATKPAEARAERIVLVTTRFENADLLLKPEMTGNAKISCGERRLIDLLSRRFLRFFKVEFWSWW